MIPYMQKGIDLGLGVLWADRNLGAERPEDPGRYFAWGETAPKEVFDRNAYRFTPEGEKDFNVDEDNYEYRYFSKYQDDDRKTILEREDDAVSAVLGYAWRIPTRKEWQDLMDNCDFRWEPEMKGVAIRSRLNGNGIFLPLTGFHYFDGLEFGDAYEGIDSFGLYWTAERPDNLVCEAVAFCAERERRRLMTIARESGLAIRGVFQGLSR